MCLRVFHTCLCNVRPGAAGDPACVSDWMKRSCPPREGGLLRQKGSSLLRPAPPGEHATCLNKKERGGKGGSAVEGGRWEDNVDMRKMMS